MNRRKTATNTATIVKATTNTDAVNGNVSMYFSTITSSCGLGYPFAGLDWKAPTKQPAQRREE
nr:MAG TPA: hypothetical protein [Caudoviricetes sp.]